MTQKEIANLKEQMITKMDQAKLQGGLSRLTLIAGCCTQNCCDATVAKSYFEQGLIDMNDVQLAIHIDFMREQLTELDIHRMLFED